MTQEKDDGIDRRGALECMIWAGTGVLWTLVGGVPRSSSLLGISEANAQAASGFTFLQISDSHIGFKAPANPNPMATLDEAIGKITALPQKPAFMLHTGDITHLSKPEEFDNADQAITKARLETFYVPGEHDIIDEGQGKAYLDRYGKRTQAKGAGWHSFDHGGVHFVGLVNVANLKAGGMGALGAEQLAWLAADLKGKSASTPIVLFAHIPLWTVSADWGWGTEDSAQALGLVKRFGSVTVLNGHIHQLMQKVEGTVTFHTARSTAFPQPAPGTAKSPGPMKVADDQLRHVLGITSVAVKQGTQPLAITDSELAKA
jgi:3',5'-cyclic AMP phosphodiesterase CpdA